MITRNRTLVDKMKAVTGGMNSGIAPTLLPMTQAAFMVNATARGGFPMPRPGYLNRTLTFSSETVRTRFQTGKFQGASLFANAQGSQLVAQIGGRLFSITLNSYAVQEVTVGISGTPDLNNANRDKVWMVQAEDWLIIQDGQAAPIIYNGVSSRRSVQSAFEVPTGTAMAYGMGRLWVALGREYVAGDIAGGPSGTGINDYRDSVLKFTENDYIAEGGSFSVPLQAGDITAMKFVANLDTALGQGALVVFATNAVFATQVPVDRTEWKNLTTPVQRIVQINFGSIGEAVAAVNGDLFYRSEDGIRTLIFGLRYFGEWANLPVSIEMDRVIAADDRNLLRLGSAANFDNRLLVTCTPQRSALGTYHLGLMVLDFHLISTLQTRLPPAYDGLWTGINVLQLVKGEVLAQERCFAFCVNDDLTAIELWEFSRAEKFDNESTRIQWSIESAMYKFGNPEELKELAFGDIWIDRLWGQADFNIDFRPDQYPGWVDWSTFTKCAAYQTCTAGCTPFVPAREQYRPRIRLPEPFPDCESATDKPLKLGYEFQVRIEITGHCRLNAFRLFANVREEDTVGACPTTEDCTIYERACESNPYSYSAG